MTFYDLPEFENEAPWYKAWRGNYPRYDYKYLPGSDGHGKKMRREVLSPLQAQIAVFFGCLDGDLASLQRGVMKLKRGEPITCQTCNQDIHTYGHLEDCEIVQQYQWTLKPPQPMLRHF